MKFSLPRISIGSCLLALGAGALTLPASAVHADFDNHHNEPYWCK